MGQNALQTRFLLRLAHLKEITFDVIEVSRHLPRSLIGVLSVQKLDETTMVVSLAASGHVTVCRDHKRRPADQVMQKRADRAVSGDAGQQ